jgi:flagellar protein FliO/FliZ
MAIRLTAPLGLLQVNPADQVGAMNSQILDYVKLLLVLAGILILVYLSIRFWIPKLTGLGGLSSGPIRVLARFPLEPRKGLYIIKAGKQHFLIGTSENGIHCLASLDPADVEPYLTPGETGRQMPGNFAGLLKRLRTPRDS